MRKLALLLWAVGACAQNPTGDLTVRMYVKPEGSRLLLLVRAPLSALSGVTLPYRSANGELDLPRVEALLPSVARWWLADNLDLFEGGTLLPKPEIAAARVSLPADNAFASYEEAARHMASAKLAEDTQIFREQAVVDFLLDYTVTSPSSSFSINSHLARWGPNVTTVLQFLPAVGAARNFDYTGDPGRFFLNPTAGQVVQRFAAAGVWQILKGAESLLFLFCIALRLRRVRELMSFAAIFAAAQSLALIASVFGFMIDALWFPLAIEALIALAILYLAFEVMVDKALIRKWILAVTSGLIFGYEFSLALNPARQFAGQHVLACVLAFDLGIAAGILLALAIFMSALLILFRFASRRLTARTETIVLSVLAADLAWHRLTDRVDRLRQFNFHWPDLGNWAVIVLVVGGAILLAIALFQQRKTRALTNASPSSPATPGPDLSS